MSCERSSAFLDQSKKVHVSWEAAVGHVARAKRRHVRSEFDLKVPKAHDCRRRRTRRKPFWQKAQYSNVLSSLSRLARTAQKRVLPNTVRKSLQ